jgi:hypothetical protein
MITQTLRGYVWVFCMYLATTTSDLMSYSFGARTEHIPSPWLFTFFTTVIAQIFLVILFLSMLREFKNTYTRGVLLFTASAFAVNVISALNRQNYTSFGFPHWVSTFLWLAATVLLGFRMDQILKWHNSEIKAN